MKLAALVVKTLSKPLAKTLKASAEEHPAFKRLCIGVARGFSALESHPRPLSESRAVTLGANFLSEAFVFGVAGSLILAESWRSKASSKARSVDVDESLYKLQESLANIQSRLAVIEQIQREQRIQQLMRSLFVPLLHRPCQHPPTS